MQLIQLIRMFNEPDYSVYNKGLNLLPICADDDMGMLDISKATFINYIKLSIKDLTHYKIADIVTKRLLASLHIGCKKSASLDTLKIIENLQLPQCAAFQMMILNGDATLLKSLCCGMSAYKIKQFIIADNHLAFKIALFVNNFEIVKLLHEYHPTLINNIVLKEDFLQTISAEAFIQWLGLHGEVEQKVFINRDCTLPTLLCKISARLTISFPQSIQDVIDNSTSYSEEQKIFHALLALATNIFYNPNQLDRVLNTISEEFIESNFDRFCNIILQSLKHDNLKTFETLLETFGKQTCIALNQIFTRFQLSYNYTTVYSLDKFILYAELYDIKPLIPLESFYKIASKDLLDDSDELTSVLKKDHDEYYEKFLTKASDNRVVACLMDDRYKNMLEYVKQDIRKMLSLFFDDASSMTIEKLKWFEKNISIVFLYENLDKMISNALITDDWVVLEWVGKKFLNNFNESCYILNKLSIFIDVLINCPHYHSMDWIFNDVLKIKSAHSRIQEKIFDKAMERIKHKLDSNFHPGRFIECSLFLGFVNKLHAQCFSDRKSFYEIFIQSYSCSEFDSHLAIHAGVDLLKILFKDMPCYLANMLSDENKLKYLITGGDFEKIKYLFNNVDIQVIKKVLLSLNNNDLITVMCNQKSMHRLAILYNFNVLHCLYRKCDRVRVEEINIPSYFNGFVVKSKEMSESNNLAYFDKDRILLCYYALKFYMLNDEDGDFENFNKLLGINYFAKEIHKEHFGEEENYLLHLAQSKSKLRYIESLMRLPEVRSLWLISHSQQGSESDSNLTIREMANHCENSTLNLSIAELNRIRKLRNHYGALIDTNEKCEKILHDLREYLKIRYENDPCLIETAMTHEGQPVWLSLPFDINQEMKDTLWNAYVENSGWDNPLILSYLKNTIHSAYRFISSPNYFISQEAEYVEPIKYKGVEYLESYYKENLPLICLFWLAAKDEKCPPLGEESVDDRINHYISELAFCVRAHNWDASYDKKNDDGSTSKVYYDDLKGDNPVCLSGLDRHLFQSLLWHPLFESFSIETIKDDVKSSVFKYFSMLIQSISSDEINELQVALDKLVDLEISQEQIAFLKRFNFSSIFCTEIKQNLCDRFGEKFFKDLTCVDYVSKMLTVSESGDAYEQLHIAKFMNIVNILNMIEQRLIENKRRIEFHDDTPIISSPRRYNFY